METADVSGPGVVIYVAHYDPSTDLNGAKMRLLSFARICRDLGFRFLFVRSTDKAVFELDSTNSFVLQGAFAENEFFRACDVVCIIFSWFWISRHSDGIMSHLRLNTPRVPTVLDTIDAVGVRQSREYITTDTQTPTSSFSFSEEVFESRRVDWVIAITEEEQHYFRGLTDMPVVVVSYSPDRIDFLAQPARREPLRDGYVSGFFGSRNYANYHSAIRACHVAWLSGHVEKFVLAGSVCRYEDLVVRLKSRYGEWLDVMGVVDDPAEFYAAVDFTTNILAFGSGIKIKVIESLTYNVPTVCNAIALEGLRHLMTPDAGMFQAETAAEFQDVLETDLPAVLSKAHRAQFTAAIQKQIFENQVREFLRKLTG